MPIDEDLFSQNIGDLERDKFKASKDNETAVRVDGRISLQSEDGAETVDVDSTHKALSTRDNQAYHMLREILAELKIMNFHLAEITGEESIQNGHDT
jgi:hypothetical protein